MSLFESQSTEFQRRHIGPNENQISEMLSTIGVRSLEELVDRTVPPAIRMKHNLNIPAAMSEMEYLEHIKAISLKNELHKNYIGQGYYDTITPSVILRNIFENPAWYTQYTPYQAEISQGRLESLLNFQTVVSDLTALPIANASLLDEATAAAEAMAMFFNTLNTDTNNILRPKFFVDIETFPQTKDVVQTRANPIGVEVVYGDYKTTRIDETYFGALVQYPNDKGSIEDYREFINKVHNAGAYIAMATDLLALTLLTPPGELGADVALGIAQRFGVPLGYGGPHAAFFAAKDEFKRTIPGRIIGVSRDASGRPALRMALQTREQHIRREKATSNVCTAQVLLAVMASMYAVWHGAEGLTTIARRIHRHTATLGAGLEQLGHTLASDVYFDTLCVEVAGGADAVIASAAERRINLRRDGDARVIVALDETVTEDDVQELLVVFAGGEPAPETGGLAADVDDRFDERFARTSPFLTHPVFNTHHSETEMLRYMRTLESRDLSLTHSMIPLGSCTMKLNATAEMFPVTWPEFGKLHPFAPVEQAQGYRELFDNLERALEEITGFAAISLQPNAGSQGEYAGLLAIRGYHRSRGETSRNVCLIPQSAHGTNPASAVMAGMTVVVTKTDAKGNIDVADLRAKAEANRDRLAALMVTYPSTHGVFEESIREICDIVHEHGGLVYMDGANMNAMVGLCRPADVGA